MEGLDKLPKVRGARCPAATVANNFTINEFLRRCLQKTMLENLKRIRDVAAKTINVDIQFSAFSKLHQVLWIEKEWTALHRGLQARFGVFWGSGLRG